MVAAADIEWSDSGEFDSNWEQDCDEETTEDNESEAIDDDQAVLEPKRNEL